MWKYYLELKYKWTSTLNHYYITTRGITGHVVHCLTLSPIRQTINNFKDHFSVNKFLFHQPGIHYLKAQKYENCFLQANYIIRKNRFFPSNKPSERTFIALLLVQSHFCTIRKLFKSNLAGNLEYKRLRILS